MKKNVLIIKKPSIMLILLLALTTCDYLPNDYSGSNDNTVIIYSGNYGYDVAYRIMD